MKLRHLEGISRQLSTPDSQGPKHSLRKLLRHPAGVLLAQLANDDNSLVGDFDGSLLVGQLDLMTGTDAPFPVRTIPGRRLGTEHGAEIGSVEVPEGTGQGGLG